MDKKWYKNSLVIVASLIIFFPIGLILMWLFASWSKVAKVAITGVFAILFIVGLAGSGSSPSTTPTATPTSQQATPDNTSMQTEQTVDEVLSLNHNELLKIAKEDPRKVLYKTYDMTLYLEQAPTTTQADFMSQPDDNSPDTILVTCNMSDKDLAKLDGVSAQTRTYKPYTLSITFSSYNDKVDLYYEANCATK